MNQMIAAFMTCFFVLSASASSDTVYKGDNQILIPYFEGVPPFNPASGALWTTFRRKENVKVKDWTLSIGPKEDGKASTAYYYLSEYATGDCYQISFQYRCPKDFTWSLSFSTPEFTPLPPSLSRTVRASSEWAEYSEKVPVPLHRHTTLLQLSSPADAVVEIKNLCVREIDPPDISGRELILDGIPCEAVYWMQTDQINTLNDYEAAKMFRFAFQRCGGKKIPLLEAVTDDDFRKKALYIGKAAEKTGIFQDGNLLQNMGEGGTVVRVNAGRAGIAGHIYGGTHLGVIQLLEHLGIWYTAEDHFYFPEQGDYHTASWEKSLNPAVPIRSSEGRAGRVALKGYTPTRYTDYTWYGNTRFDHVGTSLVSLDEFSQTHPEWFAMQADGKRLTLGCKNVHYCLSNPEFIQLYADRLLEIMRINRQCIVYSIYDGDGNDLYCRCSACQAVGSPTDLFIYFANQLAAITRKEFPQNYLMTLSYVDTFLPPKKVFPHRNVLIIYTAYSPIPWGAQNNFDHPYNELGRQNLAEWDQLCGGHMAYSGHAVNYREMMHCHPKFYFNTRFARHIGENRYKVLENCYYVATYSHGRVPGSHSFFDLGMYAQTRLCIDPKLDLEALIDRFLPMHYGPDAAPVLRQYFDIIQNAPMKSNWAQVCEEIKRGFITKELAEQCLPLLDLAEQKAGQSVHRNYVLKEKISFLWSYLTDLCLGRVNIDKADFPEYARRLAEFCSLCKERNISYMNREDFAPEWFANSHLYTISKTNPWFNTPEVAKLIADPLQTLHGRMQNAQKETPDGIMMPAKGFAGGQVSPDCGWMREDTVHAVVVRRPNSSFGMIQGTLTLRKTPDHEVKMVIKGIQDEKKEDTARMEILVNTKSFYQGTTGFQKDHWTEQTFLIPKGLLKEGENTIVIRNITEDTEKDGLCGANFVAARNYFWGWFILEQVLFADLQ